MTLSSDTPGGEDRDGRVPDFFIVGHHKSGTTALYQMLRGHPQIYMPALKEPRFFAPDLRALLGSNGSLPETWEDYLALFAAARPEQRAGEASPSYLRSQVAAGLIAQARPDARIVAILREPASFVRSLHLHLLKEGVETEPDLARAFAAESIVRGGRRVLRFLDVDESAELGAVEANAAVRVRSPRLRRAARPLHGGEGTLARALSATARLATPGGRGRARLRALRHRLTYGAPAAADERVMADLRRRFRGEVEALSEYLGRDLVSLWGYDSLA